MNNLVWMESLIQEDPATPPDVCETKNKNIEMNNSNDPVNMHKERKGMPSNLVYTVSIDGARYSLEY